MFLIILSALVLSAAFIMPDVVGFAVLVWWVPLASFVHQHQQEKMAVWAAAGGLWGIIVFGLHFWWVLTLLFTSSHASVATSFVLYGVLVSYYAATSVGLFILLGLLVRQTHHLLVTPLLLLLLGLYHFFITTWSVWFFECTNGYPFLSVHLPLINYRWYQAFMVFICGLSAAPVESSKLAIQPLSLDPSFFASTPAATKKRTPSSAAQKLYRKLSLSCTRSDNGCLYVMPESSFAFPLNEYPSVAGMLRAALYKNDALLIGTLKSDKSGQRYQSCCLMLPGNKEIWFDKTMLVDLTERVPSWLRSISMAHSLFSLEHELVAASWQSTKRCFRHQGVSVCPLICAELFFDADRIIPARKPEVIIALVNDTWFAPYFRRLMVRHARVVQLWYGVRVVYAGICSSEVFML